jgi:hypothetical protein
VPDGAPTDLWVPPGAAGSYGDEVAELAVRMGRPLDPAQRIAVDALANYGPGGGWLTLEGLIKMPRRNGKTAGVITMIAMADLFLFDADRIAWSAHLFRTTRDAFIDHQALIGAVPEFSRRVAKIYEGKGDESIELKSGAKIEYLARSKGGGRGLGGKLVVIDEALFFSADQAGALLPILATSGNPLVLYGSSGCKVESSQLRILTRRGRSNSDPSLIHVEFRAPGGWTDPGCERGVLCPHTVGTPGCSLDSPDLIRAANPAMVFGRITMDFLLSMRRTLQPLEFGREFLGWDEAGPEDETGPVDLDDWDGCLDVASEIVGPMVWAVDVSPNGSSASIGVAGPRSDGRPHLELTATGPGYGWVAPRLVELKAAHGAARIPAGKEFRDGVVVDPSGPGADVVLALRAAGIDPFLMAARDVGQACAAMQSGAKDRSFAHIGQRQVRDALEGAARRSLGDGGWAYARKRSEVDISPAVVVTNAAHGLRLAGTAQPFFGSWR